MCRLQTFPEGLVFDCGRTDVQKLLGNAVPSLIAEVLGREIRRQLLGDDEDFGPLKLMPPVRRPVPAEEPLETLPDKYRALIGDHPDHPGERRKRAKRRQSGETDLFEGVAPE
jgi:DNA (cytosine-5)-methyltransferase 1